MYRVAVCDDDKKTAELVASIIRECNPALMTECFTSGEELLENYQPCQAVFLDIDMNGMNGIETGMRIREMDKSVKIVYLTAYRDYVAGAFRVHAFQYLIKPVNRQEIRQVLKDIFDYLHTSKGEVLDFQTGQGLLCLPVEEIYYFEYLSRKVQIVTENGRYTMQEKIGIVAGRMEPFGFSMPHQSFVVNMLHVKNVLTGRILLDNGMEIPLAQKKQNVWKQELLNYLAGRLEGKRE